MPDSRSPSTHDAAPVAPEVSSVAEGAAESAQRSSAQRSPAWFTAGECALVLVLTLAAAALFRWQLGGANFVYAASGAAQLLAALGGVVACMIALRRMGMARGFGVPVDGRDLWPWGFVAASLLCFATAHALSMGEWLPRGSGVAAGNSLWRQDLAGVDQSLLWLLQYPLLWLGLLLLAWPDNVLRSRARSKNAQAQNLGIMQTVSVDGMTGQTQLMRVVTDRLIVVLAFLVVFWKMLLEQPFFVSYTPIVFAQKSLAFCFPIGIAGHLFCALMLLTAPRRRLNSRTLGLLLLALLLLAATDTIYALVVVQTFYAPGAVVDAGWIGAWLLFGVAALDGSEQVLKRRATSATPMPIAPVADENDVRVSGRKLRRRSARRNAMAWLPYFASLLACCVLLVSENFRSTELSHVLPVVGLVMAVLVRQMLSLADNLALADRLQNLNRDLERNVDDRTRHLSTLHSVVSTLNASLDERAILRATLDGLMPACHATHGGVWLRPVTQAPSRSRRIHTRISGTKITVETSKSAPADDDGWVIECSPALQENEALRNGLRRRAILQSLSGLAPHRGSDPAPDLPGAEGTIVASIRWQGALLGVIGLLRDDGEFSPADRALVDSVAVESGAALQNARLYQEASRRADRDSVTELLNHRAVQQELHAILLQARQHSSSFAVVMMDLNNFKFFNDTYGHLTGDDVLRAVAQTLSVACRESDVVGRYGGDEFIAILPESDVAGAREVCARIVDELDRHHFEAAPDSHIPIAMSFGLAIYPADGETPLELTNRADANLYQNKRNGSGGALPLIFSGRTIQRDNLNLPRDAVSGQAFGVLDALVTAIDNKDHYTRHHSEEVAQLSLLVAQELGYSSEMQRVVRMSALLHDVGKIAVPDSILRHPGRLGEDEAAIMRQHPVFGALIVRDIAHQDAVVSGVRHHHERYDGQGYPDGLRGDKIPWMGRLLAVADVYSALTTDRPYRKALSPEAALYEIESGARSQFDPHFAHTFVRVMRRELHRLSHHHPHPNTPRITARPTLRMTQPPVAKLNVIPPLDQTQCDQRKTTRRAAICPDALRVCD